MIEYFQRLWLDWLSQGIYYWSYTGIKMLSYSSTTFRKYIDDSFCRSGVLTSQSPWIGLSAGSFLCKCKFYLGATIKKTTILPKEDVRYVCYQHAWEQLKMTFILESDFAIGATLSQACRPLASFFLTLNTSSPEKEASIWLCRISSSLKTLLANKYEPLVQEVELIKGNPD